ncbi:peptidase M28 [Candidatus Koribacter versatilis Ellin345]|uniref:Carboxypeptidase Q n=1 Tax=Koribacter versatilis (strain Ellin345) TaxID=204669 RepID=Q1IQ09_KORVE|nr:M20/M25/M40 family metallo-hydrolase [Candidatus Koribacter versatilis]ABF41041.1 peptidase M28 [Candidatus Koribacter versatilis Ellin345]
MKKYACLATCLLALSFPLCAQKPEALDYNMYQRIRSEGFDHSHIMEYASALMDGIGPRLTGSPNLKHANEWTRDQFTSMGCSNAHLEDWGEFGLGWRQINTWVRMSAPDNAVFIAQALPWSPATSGPINGQAIWIEAKDEKDLEKYKGKLTGKIIFFGPMRDVKPVEKPLTKRNEDADLKKIEDFPVRVGEQHEDFLAGFIKELTFREKAGKFFADEHAAAIVVPSRDGRDNGGSGGTIFDDGGTGMGWFTYQREHAEKLPIVVTAIENYGRVYRLLKANVPVSIEMDVRTEFTGDHEHGFDTIAEIPGTDPALKDQVVMVGGHLDSWASGTGATDNGAGTVVAMEVMRILNALHVQPRRTIRVALWTGEEEGEFGSYGYVKNHFGFAPLSTAPDQLALPEFVRKPGGPIQIKPEHAKISGYFNVDNGSGKIRGIYLQGNAQLAPLFKEWIAPLSDLGVNTISVRNTGGTDHEAFDSVGIPGFQFIQDPLDYSSRTHHSNMDLYERLQPADLAQAAVVEAIFVYNTAMRDQMLPRKPLPHPELDEPGKAPLKNVMPGVVAAAEEQKKDATPEKTPEKK